MSNQNHTFTQSYYTVVKTNYELINLYKYIYMDKINGLKIN